MEASFTRKLELLGTRIGRDELRAQGFADKRKFAASIACLFYPKASTSSASHDAYAEIKANAGGGLRGSDPNGGVIVVGLGTTTAFPLRRILYCLPGK